MLLQIYEQSPARLFPKKVLFQILRIQLHLLKSHLLSFPKDSLVIYEIFLAYALYYIMMIKFLQPIGKNYHIFLLLCYTFPEVSPDGEISVLHKLIVNRCLEYMP